MTVEDVLKVISDSMIVKINDLHRNTLFLNWVQELPKEFYLRDVVHMYPFRDTEDTVGLTIVLGLE